jgi:ankyrin repeat protein
LGGTNIDLNFYIHIDGYKLYPLICAAIRGCVKMMQLILKNHTVDINFRDNNGLNCFSIGAYYGHGELMKLLAEAGINLLEVDNFGNNALHMAV